MKAESKKELISWIKTILVAVVLAVVLTQVVIVNATVPTGSMQNTIQINDRIVAYRLSYLASDPQRGDIVVFRYPDDEKQLFVKRIIGLPGDKIEGRGGKVYINGVPLEETYLKGVSTEPFSAREVPEGHYFMMGDNRSDSWDSRYWKNTFVAQEKILGKVIFRYFPAPSLIK